MEYLIAGFLGWNLGANDAANIYGTAVSSRIIKFSTAAILATIFVIIGCVLGGEEGVRTYQSIVNQDNMRVASAISLGAGISVFIMTYLKIPVSTTHSILAGILVSGLNKGEINMQPLIKVILSWFLSPLGSMLIAYTIYKFFKKFIRKKIKNIIKFEKFVKISSILIGIYGSYSLGANNVANVVGVFVKNSKLSLKMWLLLGGISISVGIITYSKRVMGTVGSKIAKIDSFGAMVAVLSTAVIVHIYSIMGVPVSSSQGIVGGVIGVGLTETIENIDINTIKKIISGWIYSIIISGVLTYILIIIFDKIMVA